MSSNLRKYYEEYEQYIQKKKVSSNSNRISTKQANIKTNKYNKSCQKFDENNNIILPFNYGNNKINSENNINLEDEIKMLEKKTLNFKKKKVLAPINNLTVTNKYFYKKDGRTQKFKLYRENELGISIFNNKVDILQAEEDYDSDDMIVMDGVKKAEEDLLEAIKLVQKNNFKDIHNYQKYYK